MRFYIRDVFLITTIVAVTLGWCIDHFSLSSRCVHQEQVINTYIEISQGLADNYANVLRSPLTIKGKTSGGYEIEVKSKTP